MQIYAIIIFYKAFDGGIFRVVITFYHVLNQYAFGVLVWRRCLGMGGRVGGGVDANILPASGRWSHSLPR